MELFTLEQLQKAFEDGFDQGRRYAKTSPLETTFTELAAQAKSDFHSEAEQEILKQAMRVLAETL